MKRMLFLWHRWMGLFGCLLMVLWFVSAFIMMYVPFPNLYDEERLAHLTPLSPNPTPIHPAAVLRQLHSEQVLRLTLKNLNDQPIYAIQTAQGWRGVSAIDGSGIQVDAHSAMRSASNFSGTAAQSATLIDIDQWSVSSSLDAHRPLWVVPMENGDVHYVSSRTGELVRDTSRVERWLGWLGSVVHWVYPTDLRKRAELWHWVVVVLSSYALLTAILGTVIGLMRWRPTGYARGNQTPYTGLLRQHHVLGLLAAVVILSWLLSGLLSMNPLKVFSNGSFTMEEKSRWRGGSLATIAELQDRPIGFKPSKLSALNQVQHPVTEIEFFPFKNELHLWLRGPQGQSTLTAQTGAAVVWDAEAVSQATQRYTSTAIAALQKLDEFDAYYYARDAKKPLPIWRVELDDPHKTWLHVDASNGQLLGKLDTSRRAQRWLYNGLHSWDFDWLLQRRPLWDIVMLAALMLGTWFSMTSAILAWRRIKL